MSVWVQMLTKQPRSTLHALDHVHEGPDMLLYLYSKYIHAVIFLPLIFLSWTSVILSVCSVSLMGHTLNEEESLVKPHHHFMLNMPRSVLIGCLQLPFQYYSKHALSAFSVEFRW